MIDRQVVARMAGVVLYALLSVETSLGATYYVSPSGSDANAGTPAAPWRTLQKAGDTAVAGDQVVVLAGTYQGFRPRNSGTAAAPVRFVAQPGVVVSSPGPANSNSDNIWVRNVNHIVVDGFEVRGAPRAGIAVQGEPTANVVGVTIRNCWAHDNSRWGIFTGFASDLLIEGNEASFSAIEHGIYVSNSGDRPVVRGNLVHDNYASGIQLNADPAQTGPDPSDPQGDGIIEAAVLEGNVIYGNGRGGGAAINLASVRSSIIRNNLLHDNHASGIAGWDDGEGTNQYGTRDNRILGNTVVQPSDGRWALLLINGSFGNQVLDNILYSYHPLRGVIAVDSSSRAGMASDYNSLMNRFSADSGDTVMGFPSWQALGYDTHSFLSTPTALFRAPGTDFHLKEGSPAIDAGLALADLATDLDGEARPQGAGSDIGADEVPVASTATATPSLTFTPVPATATPVPPTSTPVQTATSTATRSATASPTTTATRIASTATPTLTPTATIFVSGSLLYYGNSHPGIADVTVVGSTTPGGAPAMTVQSDSNGVYTMTGVGPGSWAVEPNRSESTAWPQANIVRGVSSLDATWIQEFKVGSRLLSANQRLAADTTGDGSVSSLDATRIQEWRTGALVRLPVAQSCGSDWAFVPVPAPQGDPTPVPPAAWPAPCVRGAVAYASLPSGASGQDFEAILYGDVTGNWTPAGGGAAAATEALESEQSGLAAGTGLGAARLADPPLCDSPCVVGVPGPDGTTILAANHLDDVQAFDLTLEVSAGAEVTAVSRGELAAGAGCSLLWAQHGVQVRVSLACITPIRGAGALLSAETRGTVTLEVSECTFDETDLPCAGVGGVGVGPA